MLRIAILRLRVRPPQGPADRGRISGSVALWATVPAGCAKFYANPEATSAYLDAPPELLDALRAGEIVELVETGEWDLIADDGKPRELASLRPFLEDAWGRFQAEVDDHDRHRYGTTWDDAGVWTVGELA